MQDSVRTQLGAVVKLTKMTPFYLFLFLFFIYNFIIKRKKKTKICIKKKKKTFKGSPEIFFFFENPIPLKSKQRTLRPKSLT